MRTIVVSLAVLAMVSVAGASEQVWFVATSGSAPTVQGAPGVSLVLPAPGVYTIDAYVGTTNPGGIWAFEAALSGPNSMVGSGLSSFLPPAPASGWAVQGSWIGTGAQLFDIAEGSLGTAWGPGQYKFGSFTLTAGAEGNIIGGVPVGVNGWVDADYNSGPVQFGGYWIPGSTPDGFWTTGPVISVLPEPTTLVLLGFGLVGLLRRR